MKKFPYFNYASLGFERFGDFLREGERLGYFRYCQTPPDRLSPAGQTDVLPPASGQAAQPLRFVRQDLWDAFIRDDGVTRYYDPEADTVTVNQRDNCVPIGPVAADEQKQWFRQFAERLLPPDGIDKVLQSPTWFVDVLSPGLLQDRDISAWKRYRIKNIRAAIDAWKSQHSLAIAIDAPPTRLGVSCRRTTSSPITDNDTVRTRQAILDALSRMPTQELMRLPIPLIYFDGSLLVGRSGGGFRD